MNEFCHDQTTGEIVQIVIEPIWAFDITIIVFNKNKPACGTMLEAFLFALPRIYALR